MKRLLLGTAQWGWSVARNEAFALLDQWLAAGQTEVDTATNYPINQQPADFRAAEGILTEYVQAHGLDGQLRITVKVGSMDNMRSPDHNLSPSFLLMMAGEYRRLWGNNLSGFMLHWDNRDEPEAIRATLEVLSDLAKTGLVPGLSGIKHPAIHAALCQELGLTVDIELKHNVFVSDLPRYAPFMALGQNTPQVLAYGLAAGGIKFSRHAPSEGGTFALRGGVADQFAERLAILERELPKLNTAFVRPPVVTMQQLGMVLALASPKISGAVVAPRTVAQLKETLEWHQNTDTFDYQDFLHLPRLMAQ